MPSLGSMSLDTSEQSSAHSGPRVGARRLEGAMRTLRMVLLFSFVIAQVATGAVPAEAAKRIKEFPVPTPGSLPHGIAVGPDGNLWFTERAGDKIGRITPTGVI